MKLYTINSEGLAHNSYLLIDEKDAAVFDPRRDTQIYTRLAQKNCAKIRLIFETHRNEDYVVGSKELQSQTNAKICHSKHLDFTYGERSLEDGDTLTVGNLQIKALHTPGHTDESLCYAVSNAQKSPQPLMVFTGDTLFVGAIGRTDLQGKDQQPKQAEKLYQSLHEKLLPLGDGVLVYPGHGAGSVCGRGIGKQEFSTLGYEKKTNPYLQLSKEEFVQRAVAQKMLVPAYFRKMEQYNLHGAPLLRGLALPKPLSVDEFDEAKNEVDSLVVDTRLPYAFAGSHIPGSLNLWLEGGTAVYTGWLLGYEKRILLVVERQADVERVLRHFWRQGFANIYGYLCTGISAWQEQGKPLSQVQTLSAADLQANLERYVVLDVREPSEWHQEGIIEGAMQVFFADLPKQADSLDRNKRYAVVCSVGNRAGTAASILKRKGFVAVSNVLGGMAAWKKLGYPTVKPQTPQPNSS